MILECKLQTADSPGRPPEDQSFIRVCPADDIGTSVFRMLDIAERHLLHRD